MKGDPLEEVETWQEIGTSEIACLQFTRLTFGGSQTTFCKYVIMQQLLKSWRQDALHKHQYESAIYIGDKLLAITSNSAILLHQPVP